MEAALESGLWGQHVLKARARTTAGVLEELRELRSKKGREQWEPPEMQPGARLGNNVGFCPRGKTEATEWVRAGKFPISLYFGFLLSKPLGSRSIENP